MDLFKAIIIALGLSVLGVLVLGVIKMGRPSESVRSNKLMFLRVWLQAAVFLLVGILLYMKR